MRLSRVMLEGWTASFRYPRLIAGSQPSLKAPPPATVYGLVSAACGRPVNPDNTRLGYVFRYLGAFEDLEALQKIGWNDKSGNYDKFLMPDIVHREILYEWTLFLYCDPSVAAAFGEPCYPLLLGRSGDLASVVAIDDADLEQRTAAVIGGTVFPLSAGVVPSQLVSLPLWFSTDIPRRRVTVQVFQFVSGEALELDETVHDPRVFSSWQWSAGQMNSGVPCWVDTESGYGFYLFGSENN